jgi:hypothetical protein
MSNWSVDEAKYSRHWVGRERHYDIIKEATIAFVIVALLSVGLAVMFSSPDTPSVTIQSWSKAQPAGFVDIALTELNGTSASATYGQPYNNSSGAGSSVQFLGPISIQRALGVRYPLNTAQDFILDPLATLPSDPQLTAALHIYKSADVAVQDRWISKYQKLLSKEPLSSKVVPSSTSGSGPVGRLMSSLLAMAQSGALDAQLVSHSTFYTTDYTKPLLFIGDSFVAQDVSSYWGQIVNREHLTGSQWGVMNETGSWPGQPWLWLYTMWYQISPMSTSGNADILVVAIMSVLTIALLLIPIIPGLRRIPERVPVYRLIWRQYYRDGGH